jgi:SAM-dependent methyltransferase
MRQCQVRCNADGSLQRPLQQPRRTDPYRRESERINRGRSKLKMDRRGPSRQVQNHPLKVEIVGSNPARVTTLLSKRALGRRVRYRTVQDGISGGALLRLDQPFTDAQVAGLYDALSFDDDVPLYLELAAAEGGRVLEMACGAGRVAVPLARAGHRVVGFDASTNMLSLARQKVAAQTEMEARLRLVQADLRTFDLHQHAPFDLAILAVKSLAYLTEPDDQLATLERAAAHLRPQGLLAIDFLHPKPEWLARPPGSLYNDVVQHSAEHAITISRVECVLSTDLSRQVRVIRSAYEVIDDQGAVISKRFVEWAYRYTFRFEAEHLLERAGFSIQALYGGYRREPFTSESNAMLFLARRRG